MPPGTSPIRFNPPLKSKRPSEKRSAYRVSTSSSEAEIFIATQSGPLAAKLDDLSAQGCGFVVVPQGGIELAEEAELTLRILVGGPMMPQLFVRATIRSVRKTEEDGEVRCGVRFLDTERLYSQLRLPQWRYFNRRQAFRVPPADERGRPLRGRFLIPGQSEPRSIQLHDLSSSGLATDLKPKDDITFPKALPVKVLFNLPGTEDEFELCVTFVHRTTVDGRIRTGFRIDAARTEGFEEQSERILRYVLERQRQLLLQETSKST